MALKPGVQQPLKSNTGTADEGPVSIPPGVNDRPAPPILPRVGLFFARVAIPSTGRR